MRTSCVWEMRGEADVARRRQIGGWERRAGTIKRRKEGNVLSSRELVKKDTPAPSTPLLSFGHATLASENLIILITTTIWEIHQLSQFVGETIFKCGSLGEAPHTGNGDWRLYQQQSGRRRQRPVIWHVDRSNEPLVSQFVTMIYNIASIGNKKKRMFYFSYFEKILRSYETLDGKSEQ